MSANERTDELIELRYPAPGTYTLAVHGWDIPSEPLLYSIDTWVVPGVPGSLAVVAAPTSVVVDTDGVVTVGWTGLAPGRHFGAVAHTDGTDVHAQTIVEVTV